MDKTSSNNNQKRPSFNNSKSEQMNADLLSFSSEATSTGKQVNQRLLQQQQSEQDALISPTSTSHIQANNPTERKATHSEIEKRRRQKMNKHLNELVHHLPMSMNKNKKPDKITILKMAVQHMKNLKASSSILSDSFLCQNYITPFELQSLVLKENEEFLIIIKCDSSKILYVSESCSNCIGFSSNELVDKVFFEIVHPSDSKQVKDQLTYFDQNNTIGSVSNFMLNKTKTYTSGDRRSFFCRLRTGTSSITEANNSRRSSLSNSMNYSISMQDHMYTNLETTKKADYRTVHFVGYLRSDLNTNLKYNELPTTPTSIHPPTPQSNPTMVYPHQSNLSPSMSSSSLSSPLNSSLNSNASSKLSSFTNYHSITLLSDSLASNPSLVKTATSKFSNDPYINSALSINLSQNEPSQQTSPNTSAQSTSLTNSTNSVLQYYLIAYGQIKPKTDESIHKFISRHDPDGRFIYIEPGVHFLIGYLPHQLISESLFSHVHTDDVNLLKKAFHETLANTKHKIRTHEYRFRLENNTYVTIESVLYALQNPFNSQIEYIVAQNTLCSTPINIVNTNTALKPMSSTQYVYHHQQYMQGTVVNLTNPISMPMTPSPEEIIFTSENSVNPDKILGANSQNLNLAEHDLSPNKKSPQIQQLLSGQFYSPSNRPNSAANQNQMINTHTNPVLANSQFSSPGANPHQQQQQVYQSNRIQQQQQQQQTENFSNYQMYNQQSQHSNQNLNLYRMVDSSSNNFLNTNSPNDFADVNSSKMQNIYTPQSQQQSSADDANIWMMQLFDNSDTPADLKKS